MEKTYLSVAEAAQIMGLSEQTVRQLCRDKQLKGVSRSYEPNGPFQIPFDAIAEWNNEKTENLSSTSMKSVLKQIWPAILAVGVIAAIFADSFGVWENVQSWLPPTPTPPIQDDLAITSIRTVTDVPTQIIEQPDIDFDSGKVITTGVISVHWEVFLSNKSDKDTSIISYEMVEILLNKSPEIKSYTGLEQGVFVFEEHKLSPLKFPFSIPAGGTMALYIRAGLMMDPRAYALVTKNLKQEKQIDLNQVERYLRSNGIDLYGNKYTLNTKDMFSLPSDLKEQKFAISFKTARGTEVTDAISWYTFGRYWKLNEGLSQ